LNDHTTRPAPGQRGNWVDELLLAGPDPDVALRFGTPTDRRTLRLLVRDQETTLAAAGLRPGGTVALRLAPSLGLVTALLAAWRSGAQVSLLDHRLTDAEIGRALDRLAPQVLVTAAPGAPAGPALRGWTDAATVATARPQGRPAAGPHRLIQLSSGSTGASKVIGRTPEDLAEELRRYRLLPDFPQPGSRLVLLSSMVHVLGLVGGLLHALRAGAELVLPDRLTAAGILDAVRAGDDGRPTTVIGVPFHAELLAAVTQPPPTPTLTRMIVAGERVRPTVPAAFRARYGVPLGTMYGMTEVGVIATDLDGSRRPAYDPVDGMRLRVVDGELRIATPASPYLGPADPERWSGGWLRTHDAATLDPATGRVTVLGRRDSQVSVGGLKVDLTEVELGLRAVEGVTEAVVVFDSGAIEAYVALDAGTAPEAVRAELAREFAAYKLPRHLRVLPALPRTNTGKLLRAAPALRAAAAGGQQTTAR
jgi:3-hydroxy-4-methylanthranilate adenylyltransferase